MRTLAPWSAVLTTLHHGRTERPQCTTATRMAPRARLCVLTPSLPRRDPKVEKMAVKKIGWMGPVGYSVRRDERRACGRCVRSSAMQESATAAIGAIPQPLTLQRNDAALSPSRYDADVNKGMKKSNSAQCLFKRRKTHSQSAPTRTFHEYIASVEHVLKPERINRCFDVYGHRSQV